MLLFWISAVLISKNTFKIRNDPFKSYCYCVLSSQPSLAILSPGIALILTCPSLFLQLFSLAVSVSAGIPGALRLGGALSGVAGVRKGQPLHKSHWAGEASQEASCRSCLRIVRLVPSPQARERCVWVSTLQPRWQPGALTCTWAWVLSPDSWLPLIESGALSFARMTGSGKGQMW